jgi:hypothetical protein
MDAGAASSPLAARVLRALRPHPHRGDVVAAGALPLVVAVLLLEVRFDGHWARGVLLLVALVPGAVVFGMGLAAELEEPEDGPRAYQSVLLLGGLALVLVSLLRLAQVLGVDSPVSAAGTVFWVFGSFAALAALPAWWLRSSLSLLLQLIAIAIAVLAFADWAFDAGPTARRWVLLVLVLVFLLGHLVQRERRRAHAVQFANAAGLAVVAIGAPTASIAALAVVLGAADGFFALQAASAWWELVLLAAGFGLIAYAGVDGERGPGYLGVVILLEFVVGASPYDSMLWWPLILLAMAATMLAVGLRPRRELPPEPEMPPADPPRGIASERPRPSVVPPADDDQGLR